MGRMRIDIDQEVRGLTELLEAGDPLRLAEARERMGLVHFSAGRGHDDGRSHIRGLDQDVHDTDSELIRKSHEARYPVKAASLKKFLEFMAVAAAIGAIVYEFLVE